jgi:hypothetical protein
MVTVLITSFLLLAAISYAFYCRQRTSSRQDADYGLMPPTRSGGLFGDVRDDEARSLASAEADAASAKQRATLLARAAQGERTVLADAEATGDAALYDQILDALVDQADSEKKLLALVSSITRNEKLRVNRRLAEAFIEAWKASPDRSSTAKMLHVAALSDNAAVYQRAVETAFQFWQDGLLPDVSAEELRMLLESEYWILSTGVRSSGTGFVLKLKLASLRRQMAKPVNKP